MPIEPPGPIQRALPARARGKKVPEFPDHAENRVPFLSEDPLVPLPIIDLEPLPILDPEPPEDEEEPAVAHKLHIPLGLIVDIRI